MFDAGRDTLVRYDGHGPISVSEFRRDVEALRSGGYVLPQMLHAMLDTLEGEGKKFV
jgi:hypothetical protein